jgi:hypothetical protein
MRILVYLLAVGAIVFALWAFATPPGTSARHQINQRLQCVQHVTDTPACH